jgi:lipopolysaccharide biosynthesis glycosyltransferase
MPDIIKRATTLRPVVMKQHANIVLSMNCDNDYIILMAALLKSIELHHKTPEHIEIYMAGNKITETNKEMMLRSVEPDMFTIHWMNMEDVVPPGMTLPFDRNLFPPTIYMRLFMPWVVPKEIEKILYMDVDMIILEDISNLWNNDIRDYVVGAVVDCRVTTLDNHWGGVLNYKALGLDGTHPYVNSGLQLMNTAKWRQENMAQRIIDAINNNTRYAEYAEQYALNTILPTIKWLRLPDKWNHFSTEEYKANHGIIHFISRKPMHASYAGKGIYKDMFYYYSDQTAWAHAKKIGETKRRLKKIGIVIEKIKRRFR